MMLKAAIVAVVSVLVADVANAQYFNYGTGSNSEDHYVSGHYRSNGDYVAPHYQTNPNSTTHDNYGAYGNYNYHTGRTGRGY